MSALAVQGQKSDRRQLQVVRFLSGDSSNANFNQNFADSFNNTNKSQDAKILEFKREKTKSNSVSEDRVRRRWDDRFLSSDPRGFDGGHTNLYNPMLNNPLRYVDPLGLSQEDLDAAVEIAKMLFPDSLGSTDFRFQSFSDSRIHGSASTLWNTVKISEEKYAGKLDPGEHLELLDTVIHEAHHISLGFIGSKVGQSQDLYEEVFGIEEYGSQHTGIYDFAGVMSKFYFDEYKEKVQCP